MGLTCSHGAFNRAYSAFNRMRQAIAFVMGGSCPPHYIRDENGVPNYKMEIDKSIDHEFFQIPSGDFLTIRELLAHSDCDGEITHDRCENIAKELKKILPLISKYDTAMGHNGFRNDCAKMVEVFINGLELAASKKENLLFH